MLELIVFPSEKKMHIFMNIHNYIIKLQLSK
jgi:hypothetical protein